MVCTKCHTKIGRRENLCAVYVRPSTGAHMTCIFCAKCAIEFTQFVAGQAPEAQPEKE